MSMNPTGLPDDDNVFVEGSEQIDTDQIAALQAQEQQQYMDSLPKAAQERRTKEAEEQQAMADKEASLQARTDELVEQNGSPLTGLAKWAEENVFIPIVDQLDGSRNADQVARSAAT